MSKTKTTTVEALVTRSTTPTTRRTYNTSAEDELQDLFRELESYCVQLEQETQAKPFSRSIYPLPNVDRNINTDVVDSSSQKAFYENDKSDNFDDKPDKFDDKSGNFDKPGNLEISNDVQNNVIQQDEDYDLLASYYGFDDENNDKNSPYSHESGDARAWDGVMTSRLSAAEEDKWSGFIPNPFPREKPRSVSDLIESLDIAHIREEGGVRGTESNIQTNQNLQYNRVNGHHLMRKGHARSSSRTRKCNSAPVTPVKRSIEESCTSSTHVDERVCERKTSEIHSHQKLESMCYPQFSVSASNESTLKKLKNDQLLVNDSEYFAQLRASPLTRLKNYNMKRARHLSEQTQNHKKISYGSFVGGSMKSLYKSNPNIRLSKDTQNNWTSTPLFHPFWYECMSLIQRRSGHGKPYLPPSVTSDNNPTTFINDNHRPTVDRDMFSIYKFFW